MPSACILLHIAMNLLRSFKRCFSLCVVRWLFAEVPFVIVSSKFPFNICVYHQLKSLFLKRESFALARCFLSLRLSWSLCKCGSFRIWWATEIPDLILCLRLLGPCTLNVGVSTATFFSHAASIMARESWSVSVSFISAAIRCCLSLSRAVKRSASVAKPSTFQSSWYSFGPTAFVSSLLMGSFSKTHGN